MNQPQTRRIWSNLTRAGFFILSLGLLVPPAGHSAAPTEDGIFATFEVTRGGSPLGVFHCKLEHELVPRTVANFVGLAEGSRAWVNFQKAGLSHEPFYNGRVIFRVVSNFVIQSGSANDTNSGGGPGYSFRDEFHPLLRHATNGTLSMANSGPNSNTSQFFITLGDGVADHLDDRHNVFGAVIENLSLLQTIQEGDVFNRVIITRNGAAAQSFDVNAQGLPIVEEASPTLAKTGPGFELNYEQKDDAEYFVFQSDDLTAWQQVFTSEFYLDPPPQSPRDVSALTTGKSQKFFTVARVQFPIRKDVGTGHQVVVTLPSSHTFTFDFRTATTGDYVTSLLLGRGPFPLSNYTVTRQQYTRTDYVTRIQADISGLFTKTGLELVKLDLFLDYDSGTMGATSGALLTVENTGVSLSGAFTASDL